MRLGSKLTLSYASLLGLLAVLVLALLLLFTALLGRALSRQHPPLTVQQVSSVAGQLENAGLTAPIDPGFVADTLQVGGWVQVVDAQGREVNQLSAPDWRPRAYTAAQLGALFAGEFSMQQTQYMFMPVGNQENPDGLVILAAPLASVRRISMLATPAFVRSFSTYFGLGFLASVITAAALCLLLGFLYTRRLTRPLLALSRNLSAVGSGDYSQTLPTAGKDEIATLTRSYNDLIQRLQTAEAERAHTEQARRDLIANLSHDLRTPLASLQGFAEALADLDDADTTTRAHYAGIIRRRAAELDHLLADLIELSRLQSAPALNRAPTDLPELVREAVIPIADDIAAAGLELQVDLAADLPPARVDAPLLRRAITNLLANALRHATGASFVRVAVEPAGPHALIHVRDNGPGIDPAALPHLFDRYYRGTSATEKSQGTGLGLAIVAEIARAHSGEATCRSTPGEGTTFTLRLPL